MYRFIFFVALALAIASPASSITCHGDYQVVNGQEISPPFVARQAGFHVSDSAIRNNPAKKEEVCRYLSSDIRVYTACEEVLPDDGGHN